MFRLNIPTVQMTSPLIIVLFNHNLTNDNPINNAIYTWLSHGKKIILWSHLRLSAQPAPQFQPMLVPRSSYMVYGANSHLEIQK